MGNPAIQKGGRRRGKAARSKRLVIVAEAGASAVPSFVGFARLLRGSDPSRYLWESGEEIEAEVQEIPHTARKTGTVPVLSRCPP